MAKITDPKKPTKKTNKSHNPNPLKPENPQPSWSVLRSLLTCKHLQSQLQNQQQKQKNQQNQEQPTGENIKKCKKKQEQQQKQKNQEQPTEENIKKCKKKQEQQQKQEQPPKETSKKCMKKQQKQKNQQNQEQPTEENTKKSKKIKCSGSLCSNTKVMHRPEPPSSTSPEENKKRRATSSSSIGSSRSMRLPLINELSGATNVVSSSSSSSSNAGGSFRGMPFSRFSGCYECRMVVDPVLGITRDPSLRPSICSCPHCGEIFMKAESLELHQAVRHAVSELGPEDTSKNIVEIIFQSSWLKQQTPVCKIDRILKVQNTPKTISKFEEYRDSIKSKATKFPKKHPRCIADGNELLRFHSATVLCSLGLNGSSNLCNSIPNCSICSIIKNGFRGGVAGKGILTTATSGKAHDRAAVVAAEEEEEKRAMLVCRVIAGRVRKNLDGGGGGDEEEEEFDSVASGATAGVYSNLDELYVFNPRAILPCFVVIYRGF